MRSFSNSWLPLPRLRPRQIRGKKRADQARAEEDQQRLEDMKRQYEVHTQYLEAEKQQREAEANIRREQHKKDMAEKERQQRIKLLPALQPMTPTEDVADFLEMFAANMRDWEIPKASWANHLL